MGASGTAKTGTDSAFNKLVSEYYTQEMPQTDFPAAAREVLTQEGVDAAVITRFINCESADNTPALCRSEIGSDQPSRNRLADVLRPYLEMSPEILRATDELFAYMDVNSIPYEPTLAMLENAVVKFGHATVENLVRRVDPYIILGQLQCYALIGNLALRQKNAPAPDLGKLSPRLAKDRAAHVNLVHQKIMTWDVLVIHPSQDKIPTDGTLATYNPELDHLTIFTMPSLFNVSDQYTLLHELFHVWQDHQSDEITIYHLEREANLAAAADLLVLHPEVVGATDHFQNFIRELQAKMDARSEFIGSLNGAQVEKNSADANLPEARVRASLAKMQAMMNAEVGVSPKDNVAATALGLVHQLTESHSDLDTSAYDFQMGLATFAPLFAQLEQMAATEVMSRIKNTDPLASLDQLEKGVGDTLGQLFTAVGVAGEHDPHLAMREKIRPVIADMRRPEVDTRTVMGTTESQLLIEHYSNYLFLLMMDFEIHLGRLFVLALNPELDPDGQKYLGAENDLLVFAKKNILPLHLDPPSLLQLARPTQ